MRRAARTRVAGLSLAVIALIVSAVGCGTPPPPDFYQPPPSLTGRPGDVIATVATNFGLNGDVTSTAIKYGVPSDLGPLAEYLDGPGNLFFSFLAFAAVGLDAAYPELNLESYLNDTGRQLLEQGRSTCLIDGLPLAAGRHISDLTTRNPLVEPQWQAAIAEQRLGDVAPAAPVLLYHGSLDEIIPFAQGTRLRDAWCSGGGRVEWQEHFTDHVLGVLIDAAAWLDARFKRQAFTPTCN